mgnify:CR=1 FL=1
MFDLGFSEIILIGVVALVVLGPERLPVVARVVGKYFSKARRVIDQLKEDIALESEMAELKSLQSQARTIAEEVTHSVRGQMQSIQGEVDSLREDLDLLGNQDKSRSLTESRADTKISALSGRSDDFSVVHPVQTPSFSRRYKEDPDVRELAEQVERLKRDIGETSASLTVRRNRRYAVRSRTNSVRIYR